MAAPHRVHGELGRVLDATPFLRAYARRRWAALDSQDAVSTQRRQLAALLRRAAATRFGLTYGFRDIAGVADYQSRVPLRTWEDFWREWWQPAFPALRDISWPGLVPAFANTSGTTGGPNKRIPVSNAMMRSNRLSALDVQVFHLRARPNSRLWAGRTLMLGGTTALEQLAPGIVAGDLSGLAAADVPRWARSRTFPPTDIALMSDWGKKITLMAARSLAEPITAIAGTTSWLLLFLESLGRLQPGRRLADIYPDLELVVHGGVGFAPYRAAFDRWLEGSNALTREVYPASEGFFGIADLGEGEGLRVLLDRGIFYEFVRPEDLGAEHPDRRWIATAEPGVEYALVLTTNAGLWSYVIGDTVTLLEGSAPRLRVTGRLGWALSVAGEHLIGAELDAAIAAASETVGRACTDYSAVPLAPDATDPRPGHLFLVELDQPTGPEAIPRFAARLDATFQAGNADYAAHRQGGFGLRPPEVQFVTPGTFAAWMARRGKLGGQNKVPRVVADEELRRDLLQFIGRSDV